MRRDAALALLPVLLWLALGATMSFMDRRGLDATVWAEPGDAGQDLSGNSDQNTATTRVPGLILRTAAPLTDTLHRFWPAAADERMPVSMPFPGWSVSYSGELKTGTGPCRVRLRYRGDAQLAVDGRPLTRQARRSWKRAGWEDLFALPTAAPGWIPITVSHRQAASHPSDRYDMRGAISCNGAAFAPLDEGRVRRGRGGLPLSLVQWLAIGLLLLAVPAMWRTRGASLQLAGTLGLILVLGAATRVTGAAFEPIWGETMDEQANAWSAWHIARGEAPRSWIDRDFTEAYDEVEELQFAGDTWFLAQPYIDRPPLLALLAAPLTMDSRAFWHTPLLRLRSLSLLFSCLTMVGVWATARRLWHNHRDREVLALVATGLLAVCIPAAMGGRLFKAEGLIVCLGGLAALSGLSRGQPLALVVCGLLLPWAKETGAIMAVAVGALLFVEGRRKAAGMLVSATILGLLTVFGYGALLSGESLVGVASLQANKPTALHNIALLLTRGPLAHQAFPPGDGWMVALVLLGLGSLFRTESTIPQTRGLATALLVLLVGLAALVNGAVYGWYRLLLYPGLVLLAAPAVIDIWRRPKGFVLAGVYGLLVLLPLQGLLGSETSGQPWVHRLLLLPMLLVVGLELNPHKRAKTLLRGICLALLIAAAWVSCMTAMFPLRGT